MHQSKRAATFAGVAALVVIAVLSVIVALEPWRSGNGDGSVARPATPSTTPSTGPTGEDAEPSPVAKPTSPATGALVGAAVQPAQGSYTVEGRMQAFRQFEQRVGRQLDLVHTYHAWDPAKDKTGFPNEGELQLAAEGRQLVISWAGADTRSIVSGAFDDDIRARARQVRSAGVPIFLMWRGEMDRPNLQTEMWSPADYVAAWKHIRAVFTAEGATNVAWVWCPTAKGFEPSTEADAHPDARDYYPGDDQVDWLCVDAYPGPSVRPMSQILAPFLAWAKAHPKPIMIGEFGISDRGPGVRERWLAEMGSFVKAVPELKAFMYFNGNDDGKGPRAVLRLDDSTSSVRAFRALLAQPYFNTERRPVS